MVGYQKLSLTGYEYVVTIAGSGMSIQLAYYYLRWETGTCISSTLFNRISIVLSSKTLLNEIISAST